MNRPAPHTSRRPGMTLIELLVVVTIIVLLAGAFVPMVQPLTRGRRVREATRQLNVYISGAQARAVERGRPVGIWLERAGHEPSDAMNLWYSCYKVHLAEQPEPYTGDQFNSQVTLQYDSASSQWYAYFDDPANPSDASCCDNLVASRTIAAGLATSGIEPSVAPLGSVGDLIRFEGHGTAFPITEITDKRIGFFVDNVNDQEVLQKYLRAPLATTLPTLYDAGIRFEIIRRPVKSLSAPLEMPRNTAIDLSLSGYGTPFLSPLMMPYATLRPGAVPAPATPARFREINPEYDVIIMFRPQGGIDRVYYASHEPELLGVPPVPTFMEQPQNPIHLLVCRDDEIARDTQKKPNQDLTNDWIKNVVSSLGEASLADADNNWLTLSSQSGRVMIAPNNNPFPTTVPSVLPRPGVNATNFLLDARKFALTARAMGGN